MPEPTFESTIEHDAIFAATDSNQSVAIRAGAGTGKTATAVQIARRRPDRQTLYLAFNRSVADQAKARFPSNVSVKTAHSLAFGRIGKHFAHRITPNVWKLRSAIEDRFTSVWNRVGGAPAHRQAALFASITAIETFCQSADPTLDPKHVPPGPGYNQEMVAAVARRLFRAMSNPNETIPVLHDLYLKLYQLSKPVIRAHTILYDEAQDSNPAMLDIVLRQRAQLVIIGDASQAIYGWRGAVDAFDAITLQTLPLSESWRFGQPIADVANRILHSKERDLGMRLVGRGGPSTVNTTIPGSSPNAILSRSNAGLLIHAAQYARSGRRICITGGAEGLMSHLGATYDLWKYGHSNHPAFAMFASWNDLLEIAETRLGANYHQYVDMVTQHLNDTPELIRTVTNACVNEASADVILSTVHKYKGLQADHVRIGDDFAPFCIEDETDERTQTTYTYNDAEANLAYVAITRAAKTLELGGYARVLAESLANRRAMIANQISAKSAFMSAHF